MPTLPTWSLVAFVFATLFMLGVFATWAFAFTPFSGVAELIAAIALGGLLVQGGAYLVRKARRADSATFKSQRKL